MAELQRKDGNTPPAYRQSLLAEEPGQESASRQCRKKQKSYHTIIGVVVGCALIAMAIMFASGWFAGVHYGNKAPAQSKQQQSNSADEYQNALYYDVVTSTGQTTLVSVIEGSVPVTDFVQCNYVNGSCQSGNPLLTPKGKALLTLYRYDGQVSYIVTSTGANYGEQAAALSLTRRRRDAALYLYTLDVKNCTGNLMHPIRNDYHELDQLTRVSPSGMQSSISHDQHSSHTTIMQLDSKLATDIQHLQQCRFIISNKDNSRVPWSVRGTGSINDIDLKDSDLTLKQKAQVQTMAESKENAALAWRPPTVDVQQFYYKRPSASPSYSDADQSYAADPVETPEFRKRRAAPTSGSANMQGMRYTLFDHQTKAATSTIMLLNDKHHGGPNGTMTYDIINHLTQCRSRFSMLYHQALSNGREMVNTTHHQTFMYQYQDAAGARNMSMWQSVTPFSNKLTSSSYQLVGKRPTTLPCFTDEMKDLRSRLLAGRNAATTASPVRSGRSLSWKCGVVDSVKEGYDCADGAYKCGSDIAEGDVTLGLSLIEAAYNCYGAVDSCYHLVHNCVGGL